MGFDNETPYSSSINTERVTQFFNPVRKESLPGDPASKFIYTDSETIKRALLKHCLTSRIQLEELGLGL